jgi:hypothetical protein
MRMLIITLERAATRKIAILLIVLKQPKRIATACWVHLDLVSHAQTSIVLILQIKITALAVTKMLLVDRVYTPMS